MDMFYDGINDCEPDEWDTINANEADDYRDEFGNIDHGRPDRQRAERVPGGRRLMPACRSLCAQGVRCELPEGHRGTHAGGSFRWHRSHALVPRTLADALRDAAALLRSEVGGDEAYDLADACEGVAAGADVRTVCADKLNKEGIHHD